MSNLIDNALKYGKAAHVDIRTANAIEITVDDEGPGFPKKNWSKSFSRSIGWRNREIRETGGIGLGLAIAQSIVQAHGGTLKLIIERRAAYELELSCLDETVSQ